jgi:hypothetical protein
MDVHCSTCNESWDVYHLWHDAIFETGLSVEEAEAWCALPRDQKLSARYRTEFRAVGWQFGRTVINVIHCPACPKTRSQTGNGCKPRPPLSNSWVTTRADWPQHSRITGYEAEVTPR